MFRLNYHVVINNPDDVAKYEEAFAEELKSRGADFKFFKDQYGEHPDERKVKNEEHTEKLDSLETLTNIFGNLKNKVVPLCTSISAWKHPPSLLTHCRTRRLRPFAFR